MRLVWLLCIVLLGSRTCFAEEFDEGVEVETPENNEPSKTEEAAPEKPTFERPEKPSDALLALYFDSADDLKKMVLSTATKDGVEADLAKYDGKWAVEVPKTCAMNEDYALVLKSEGKHHAIAVDLGRDFKFDSEEFVVQYEVKFMEGQTCGGAYIKLLSASKDLDLKNFRDKTPYTIMFGPDKCGADSKLHFIFRHMNPKSGEYEEKHMNAPTQALESFFTDKKTHLYTLVLRADNSFEVYVDQSLVKSGNLLSDFTPAVNPPKEIVNPDDKKPTDWDDRPQVPDPDATKPDDWNEDAPQFIIDEAATMPDGWLENEPKLVANPDAKQPEDWDTETDGDWEPPMIDNPVCASAPGCGKWEKPTIPNPEYKGKWTPPMIANKAYMGEWKPTMIPNPHYFEDEHPYRMTPIRALGLELWSMTAEIAFDNFFIGTSKASADAFAAETWAVKQKAEKAASPSSKTVIDGVVDLAANQPMVLAACVLACLFVFVLITYCCCRGASDHAAAVAKQKKTDEPVPDDEEEEEEKEEESGDAKKESASEKDEEEGDEEEEGEEEKPKKTTRQRTRKE